jgi:hypothetical protein
MSNTPDETFLDNTDPLLHFNKSTDIEIETSDDEKAKKQALARKRIDELMEQKRLRELLDDSDDW